MTAKLLSTLVYALAAGVAVAIPRPLPAGEQLAARATTTSSVKAATSTSASSSNTVIYGVNQAIYPPSPSQLGTACQHGANSRNCWGRYDINTNYYQNWPNTGVTRNYTFTLTEVSYAPDGISRPMMLINNQFVGPPITADWGDTIRVTLINKLKSNGSSFHFHGMRQYRSTEMDGANGVTECPTAPGDTHVYTFLATQYGTSWYHSHFSLQLGEGIIGPMIINGPASANYDQDAGTVAVGDLYHQTTFSLFQAAQTRGPPLADNGHINGMNVYNCSGSTESQCSGKTLTGSRWQQVWTQGQRYRLRFINTAVDSMFRIQIDGHSMTVISTDFVPIKPYVTKEIFIAIGQRYDVIVTANQPLGNYFLRAIAINACSNMRNPDNVRAIIRYAGQSVAQMTATPPETPSTFNNTCIDENQASLTPVVPVNPTSFSNSASGGGAPDLPIGLIQQNGVFKWTLKSIPIVVDWENPTTLQILNGNTSASTYPASRNIIELKQVNQWVYFVIDSQIPVAHPIHLHGHDFSILAQGQGSYSASTPLNMNNPPRRDVALMPAGGFLVIGFITDNPGTWLMHCHIAWHVAEGLSVQFMERATEINSWVGGGVNSYMQQTCKPWRAWVSGPPPFPQDDSGL